MKNFRSIFSDILAIFLSPQWSGNELRQLGSEILSSLEPTMISLAFIFLISVIKENVDVLLNFLLASGMPKRGEKVKVDILV